MNLVRRIADQESDIVPILGQFLRSELAQVGHNLSQSNHGQLQSRIGWPMLSGNDSPSSGA